MSKKKNQHHGAALDSFLKEEGALEPFRAAAIKEVIAWQTAKEHMMQSSMRAVFGQAEC